MIVVKKSAGQALRIADLDIRSEVSIKRSREDGSSVWVARHDSKLFSRFRLSLRAHKVAAVLT